MYVFYYDQMYMWTDNYSVTKRKIFYPEGNPDFN